MIDLLSKHLYRGPEVYLRELLQNGVDAIAARAVLQPDHAGRISITLTGGETPTLVFEDDGIGLSEPEIHAFLATIGRSSKRGTSDFIGQFGIGLLSCFVVADEIELVSRSATGTPAVRWLGSADGQYTITPADDDEAVGTRVVLRAKPGREDYFDPARVRAWCANYGDLLPYPIEVTDATRREAVNGTGAPWTVPYPDRRERHEALMRYGAALLGTEPFDVVPIRTEAGGVEGVAYVLPWTPTLAVRGKHRVYLRSMLLSEDSDNLVPDWGFFVKCVLDARDLRPNAARDALHEDEILRAAREEIGLALRGYLLDLARHDPGRLRSLISLHYLSIKTLALEDDEFFDLVIPWLPFETSLGRMTLTEYLGRSARLRYVSDLHLFRQIAQVAGASGQAVIQAVYTHEAALLEKYGRRHPDVRVERLDAASFAAEFAGLTPDERRDHAPFVRAANEVLLELGCEVRLARFQPADLPALYLPGGVLPPLTNRERAARGETGAGLWADVLADLDDLLWSEPTSILHLNLDNPLVRRATAHSGVTLRRVVGLLYVQALLLGHQPFGAREMRLLNDGMMELVAVDAAENLTAKTLN